MGVEVPEPIAFGIGFMAPGMILAGLGFAGSGIMAGSIAAGIHGTQTRKNFEP